MSCNCEKSKVNYHIIPDILPSETCPLCSKKHLSLAMVLVLEGEDDLKILGELFASYKHAPLELSLKIFPVIESVSSGDKINVDTIMQLVEECDKAIYVYNGEQEIIKDTLPVKDKIKTYLAYAYELSKEIGYESINRTYIIGILTYIARLIDKKDIQASIRSLWKSIEADVELDFDLIKKIVAETK